VKHDVSIPVCSMCTEEDLLTDCVKVKDMNPEKRHSKLLPVAFSNGASDSKSLIESEHETVVVEEARVSSCVCDSLDPLMVDLPVVPVEVKGSDHDDSVLTSAIDDPSSNKKYKLLVPDVKPEETNQEKNFSMSEVPEEPLNDWPGQPADPCIFGGETRTEDRTLCGHVLSIYADQWSSRWCLWYRGRTQCTQLC